LPLVTVIIPTYNRAQTLCCAIQSVLNQDFTDFEIQVVGDCCTDESEEVVLSFKDPRIQWTNLPKRIGIQSGPNNEGLRRSKGKYIAYLGHDDLWLPWHLSSLLKMMEGNNDFAASLIARILPMQKVEIFKAISSDKKSPYHYPVPSSWMHCKSIVDTIGFWRTDPENLFFSVDRDFFLRLKKAGFSVKLCPHLSAIKFPAPSWNIYRRTEFPQEEYIQKILNDPKKLQIDILTQIAIKEASQVDQKRSMIHKTLRSLVDLYGRERWPMNRILNLYVRYSINKSKRQRGLIQS